jgi:hypothetical protein
MAHLISATDLAIRKAYILGTLRVERKTGRVGEYFAICDESGLIEIALTESEAQSRIRAICI